MTDAWYEQVFAILRVMQEDMVGIKLSLAAMDRSVCNIEQMVREWPL